MFGVPSRSGTRLGLCLFFYLISYSIHSFPSFVRSSSFSFFFISLYPFHIYQTNQNQKDMNDVDDDRRMNNNNNKNPKQPKKRNTHTDNILYKNKQNNTFCFCFLLSPKNTVIKSEHDGHKYKNAMNEHPIYLFYLNHGYIFSPCFIFYGTSTSTYCTPSRKAFVRWSSWWSYRTTSTCVSIFGVKSAKQYGVPVQVVQFHTWISHLPTMYS